MELDNKGQITVELILILSFILIIIISITSIAGSANELNMAMLAAEQGALNGASGNGLAIFPQEAYKNYSSNIDKQGILNPKNIHIINIKKTEKGKDALNKTRIQLKVYASCPNIPTREEKESIGDRINYNMRKSIVKSFKSENISNKLYNTAFSDSYSFTTANVEWV
jgi:hypothetical protein